jgi:drug/metabolite transporter (DMT)-like permease
MAVQGISFSSYEKILQLKWYYLYFALLPTLLAPLMWFRVLKEYKLSSISLFSFISPLLIAFFSYIILKEPLTIKFGISLLLVSISILFSELKSQNLPIENM